MDKLLQITWSEEFNTGVRVIDDQHRNLFAIYNRLADQLNHTGTPASISALIDELIKYTTSHFTFEEKLMEKYGYADRENHMEEHTLFIDRVMELAEGNAEGHSRESSTEFAQFLQDWLVDHIMTVDKGYCSVIPADA